MDRSAFIAMCAYIYEAKCVQAPSGAVTQL